jgi:hypothetical protein
MRYAGQTEGKPLTAAQARQLQALLAGGALSRESAKGPGDRLEYCSPLVVGALQSLGLAASRVRREGARDNRTGGQVTLYWLTEAGAERAAALAEEARR